MNEGEGDGEGEGAGDMDVIITNTYYILPIDCLLIALDADMFSHNGYGPGVPAQQLLGPGPGSRAHIHYG